MLTLRSATNVIVVAPEHGAGVIGWMAGCTPLLRRAVPSAVVAGDPHTMGWFPLVPYCNRIGHGRFDWLGQQHHLAPNFGDNPHTIHGIGWQRAWTVGSVTADQARLTLDHAADPSWPFAFRAEIIYRLTPDAVMVSIAVTNSHHTPAPAGIGLHPYFPKANQAALRFDARNVWVNGPDMLPSRHDAIPPGWNHKTERLAAAERLDNCFTGWDGKADISAGPASLRIEASKTLGNLQVFTPDWGDFFCAEPVSHVPDALNRPDLPPGQGMAALPSQATLSGTIRMSLAQPPPAKPRHTAPA